MRVRMAATISGTRNGRDWPRRGEEIDLPDAEAAALCGQKLATPVARRPADAAETTTLASPAEERTPEPDTPLSIDSEPENTPTTSRTGPARKRTRRRTTGPGAGRGES